MKNVTTSMIAAAAVAGLFAGASAVRAGTTTTVTSGRAMTSSSRTASSATTVAGQKATKLDDSAGKHDCKGKNDCKGKGGCKESDNGCKGKNSCKGKGGCKSDKPRRRASRRSCKIWIGMRGKSTSKGGTSPFFVLWRLLGGNCWPRTRGEDRLFERVRTPRLRSGF